MRKELLSSLLCKCRNKALAELINLCKDTQLENGSTWLRCNSAPKHMPFLFYKHVSLRFQDVLVKELSLGKGVLVMSYLVGPAPSALRSHKAALQSEDEGRRYPRFPKGCFTQNKLSVFSASRGVAHQAVLIVQTCISIPWQSLEGTQI